MELIATNDVSETRTFDNVIDLDRDESGDLLVHIDVGDGATKWERVIDGRVERLK